MLISIAPLYQNQSGAVVKQLYLVIYVDFQGKTIAKISEADLQNVILIMQN